ncbi:DUF2851 family protein [Pricia sp. S334]|uniref:DUF2851 family protein n=1 Tax=Pricia mediterranea TaxID=3076079 RepID=A0ABU3L262_9FLAO|nr:DUF2851 family protein [Pricia sp. S334]MDT7827831.1 DUF2851 family protein [Pricia sp. S334]
MSSKKWTLNSGFLLNTQYSVLSTQYYLTLREDLLHFIWKYRKLCTTELVGTNNEPIRIVEPGIHNHLAGPDFFNAKLSIDGQLWAGNVEIHLSSSDWYAHHHERDSNYDNVILHVVWEDDAAVFYSDNSQIPTLELRNYISQNLLDDYQNLFDRNGTGFINCEKHIAEIDTFLLDNWLERLYFERLERKATLVLELLETSKNDWEQVLFALLLKNFGLKVNGSPFLSLAQALDFSTVRKLQFDSLTLESVFYGMSHLLDSDEIFDDYYIRLKKEYVYSRKKFDLKADAVQKPHFFKLRPPNFPTIRLSQLANLYATHQNLFSRVIHATDLSEIRSLFNVSASGYWNRHYTFGKPSRKSTKKLTGKFIDLLVINSLLPLKFCYARHQGKDANEEIIQIISQIKKEENSVIANYERVGVGIENAKESQALLQLYNEYCTQNKCLQCAVGSRLLHENC